MDNPEMLATLAK